jgi:hypothetical protein
MRNIIAIGTLFLILVGCSNEGDKFPINYSCMGGVGVLLQKNKAIIGQQTFNFESQTGNIRKYKDSVENTILSFDIASENLILIKMNGNSVEGMIPITDCRKIK